MQLSLSSARALPALATATSIDTATAICLPAFFMTIPPCFDIDLSRIRAARPILVDRDGVHSPRLTTSFGAGACAPDLSIGSWARTILPSCRSYAPPGDRLQQKVPPDLSSIYLKIMNIASRTTELKFRPSPGSPGLR